MARLHGHPPAAVANILHGCQFVLADVLGIHGECSAEAALSLVAAGIAEVSGFIGHRTTGFAGICHNHPPSFFDSHNPNFADIDADNPALIFESPGLP
jgi:hypothetical protein